MELRTLLKILKRYWFLVVLPPILVGVFTLITYRAPATSYTSTLRFSVGYAPEQQTTSLYDRKYPAWLTSEYIAGGLSDWAKTGDFAQAVASVAGGDITAGEVAGSIVSDHLRSIVVLYLNGGDPDRLTADRQCGDQGAANAQQRDLPAERRRRHRHRARWRGRRARLRPRCALASTFRFASR